jgi:hypothetical protein
MFAGTDNSNIPTHTSSSNSMDNVTAHGPTGDEGVEPAEKLMLENQQLKDSRICKVINLPSTVTFCLLAVGSQRSSSCLILTQKWIIEIPVVIWTWTVRYVTVPVAVPCPCFPRMCPQLNLKLQINSVFLTLILAKRAVFKWFVACCQKVLSIYLKNRCKLCPVSKLCFYW